MKIENPKAFSFIMQDEIYLLDKDKTAYSTATNPAETLPIIEETQPVSFNYSGGHKKSFLVIVHYPDHDFMDEIHLGALENTIKRLGYSLDDIAIFNRAIYEDAGFETVNDFFKPQKMLLLGQKSLPAGIEVIPLNKQTRLNNCDTLLTFSFEEMIDSNDNKKAFWEQMKQL